MFIHLLLTTILPMFASALPAQHVITGCTRDLVRVEDVFAKYPELDRNFLATFTWVTAPTPATVALERFTGTLENPKTGNVRLSLIRGSQPYAIGVALRINFESREAQANFVERIVGLKLPGSISEILVTNEHVFKGDVSISNSINDPERSRRLLEFAAHLVGCLRAGYSITELLGP